MNCQSLFSVKKKKNKKNIINLSSAEYAQRVVKAKVVTVIDKRAIQKNISEDLLRWHVW